MKRVLRTDAGRLGKATRLGTGGVRVPAVLARIGIQTYRRDDGTTVREYRPAEEVFDAAALASLADAPITRGHPGMVTTDTWREHAVGHVSAGARRDGEHVAADVVIHDAATIDAIEREDLAECSVGYLVELDPTPGTTPTGERYDAVQRRIRANHVGLGPRGWGRAGRDVALRLDSNGHAVLGTEEKRPMKSIRIDGIDYPLGTDAEREAAAQAMSRYQAKLDAERAEAATKLASEKTRADVAEAKVAETTKRLDAATTELATTKTALAEATDPKRLDARVAERTSLLQGATRVLGTDVKLDGQTDLEIRTAVVAKAMPAVKLDGKSADAIGALYEAALAAAPCSGAQHLDSLGDIGRTVPVGSAPQVRQDARGEPNEFVAADRSRSSNANLWKGQQAATQTAPAGR